MKPITVKRVPRHKSGTHPVEPRSEPKLDELDEAWTLAAIERASHFLVSLFLGRGSWDTLPPLDILARAHRAGLLLEKVHANGRTHLIYAVTPEGRSVLIPAPLLAKLLGAAESMED
jgi:hypothetical protein